MSEDNIVEFISDKVAILKLTNYNLEDDALSTIENPTIELRFAKKAKNEVAVEAWNATNNSMLPGAMAQCKIGSALVNKLIGKGKKTVIYEMLIEALGGDAEVGFDSLNKGLEIKNRILSGCTDIYRGWSSDSTTSGIITGLPDFDAKIPKKIPLFGFVIDENKKILTEGFWAMYDGEPRLFVYMSIVETEIGTDLEKTSKPERAEIVPFPTSEQDSAELEQGWQFNRDLLPPYFTQDWLVSPSVFKRRDVAIDQIEMGKTIFRELYNIIIPNHLLIPNESERKALAYWIMGTYFYDVFDAYPIGHGWGFYGSGKSRLGTLVVSLAYHGMFGINITSADLFRTKEEFKPTLVIDENEENLRDVVTIKDDMINGSYVRGGGSVSRRREVQTSAGKIYVRDTFDLYSPTFFCSINQMRTPASRSRTITFPMVKRAVTVPIAERRLYKNLIDSLYEYRFKTWQSAREIYVQLNKEGVEGVKGREHELWLPIFTMMKLIDREDSDFEDIKKFIDWNRKYKLQEDMIDEERPTLYAAIAKLWHEVYNEGKGTLKDSKSEEGYWFRHPNQQENIWEFKISDLTEIMKAIADEIGYKKTIKNEIVGRSASKLGFAKHQTPNTRNSTFIFNINIFKHIVFDHMNISIEELGAREYDSKESLIKDWTEDTTK